MTESGDVRITLADVYHETVKLIGFMTTIQEKAAVADHLHADHEGRLRALEIAQQHKEELLLRSIEALQQRNTHADQLHSDHEARLRRMERWMYGLPVSIVLAIGDTALAIKNMR